MGKETDIGWTHHTFNPWRGCVKVSPGCKNCYAERLSARNPRVLGEWGPKGRRAIASESG
jgi:protein gp37